MRVKLPEWIETLSGQFDSLVFYPYPGLQNTCFARAKVDREITAGNTAFGLKCHAICGVTWPAADSAFKDDMETYAEAWNATQLDGRNEIPLSDLNVFVKACFAAADANSFDLTTLTVNNFGGTIGDLLGTEDATVGNLIETAGLPSCGLTLSSLNNPIIAI